MSGGCSFSCNARDESGIASGKVSEKRGLQRQRVEPTLATHVRYKSMSSLDGNISRQVDSFTAGFFFFILHVLPNSESHCATWPSWGNGMGCLWFEDLVKKIYKPKSDRFMIELKRINSQQLMLHNYSCQKELMLHNSNSLVDLYFAYQFQEKGTWVSIWIFLLFRRKGYMSSPSIMYQLN